MRSISISLALVVLTMTTGPLDAQSDTSITYQGELIEEGSPANGIFNMEFALFTSLLTGVQVGATEFDDNVSVANGQFTVELDFGAEAFSGSNRWLEITVNGIELSPRQRITPAPYAIQTRGMYVDEDRNVGIGTNIPISPLHVTSDSSDSGISTIYADNFTGSGRTYAVFGETSSTEGIGVSGLANANSGSAVGGFFTSQSTRGTGVKGWATGTSGVNYGGDFLSFSTEGRAVQGCALTTSGLNYGIRGETQSPSGYAGAFFGGRNYFEGNVGIGEMSPQSQLHVRHGAVGNGWGIRINSAVAGNHQGGIRISNDGFLDLTNRANISSPSFARLNSAGVWTVVSDRCMKADVAPLTGVLDRAMNLDPVSYWYHNQDRTRLPDRQIGLIAQDVEPHFPSLVSQGDDLMTLNYDGLGVVAIAALQELKHQTDVEMNELREEKDQQLAERDAEIARQNSEITKLANRLDQMESMLARLTEDTKD